jgi:hypothetical protein
MPNLRTPQSVKKSQPGDCEKHTRYRACAANSLCHASDVITFPFEQSIFEGKPSLNRDFFWQRPNVHLDPDHRQDSMDRFARGITKNATVEQEGKEANDGQRGATLKIAGLTDRLDLHWLVVVPMVISLGLRSAVHALVCASPRKVPVFDSQIHDPQRLRATSSTLERVWYVFVPTLIAFGHAASAGRLEWCGANAALRSNKRTLRATTRFRSAGIHLLTLRSVGQFNKEQIGPLQLDGGRDTPAHPVENALDATGLLVLKKFGDFRRAAERINQLCVGMEFSAISHDLFKHGV